MRNPMLACICGVGSSIPVVTEIARVILLRAGIATVPPGSGVQDVVAAPPKEHQKVDPVSFTISSTSTELSVPSPPGPGLSVTVKSRATIALLGELVSPAICWFWVNAVTPETGTNPETVSRTPNCGGISTPALIKAPKPVESIPSSWSALPPLGAAQLTAPAWVTDCTASFDEQLPVIRCWIEDASMSPALSEPSTTLLELTEFGASLPT